MKVLLALLLLASPLLAETPKPSDPKAEKVPLDTLVDQFVSKTKPSVPPKVTITGPKSVRIGHAVYIEAVITGDVRKVDLKKCLKIIPEPLPTDFHPDPGGDPCKLSFSGEAGDYMIYATVIGRDEGWDQAELMVSIIDPNAQAVMQDAAPTPDQILADAVAVVVSNNKKVELAEIIDAGRQTAKDIRGGRKQKDAAVKEWGTASYVALPNSFRPWNNSIEGKPIFFETIKKIFDENNKLPTADPANLLDSLCDILEKIASGLPSGK